jgi:hypothetical protein
LSPGLKLLADKHYRRLVHLNLRINGSFRNTLLPLLRKGIVTQQSSAK